MRSGRFVLQRCLMQSSTRAMRPVAITTLVSLLVLRIRVVSRPSIHLLCNVGRGLNERLVTQPHVAGRYPSTGMFVGSNLIR